MPIYAYKCKCGWTGEYIKPAHKRDHVCPECKEPLKPLPPTGTARRWKRGVPS